MFPPFPGKFKGEGNKGPWRLSLREGGLGYKGAIAGMWRLRDFAPHPTFSREREISGGSLAREVCGSQRGRGLWISPTDKGEVRIKKFKGSLKGSSKSGPVRASMEPDQVEVYSSEGTLRFHFMGYGAELVAYSERGKIYAPRRLSRDFSGRAYKVMGRLKGEAEKGKNFLKKQTQGQFTLTDCNSLSKS